MPLRSQPTPPNSSSRNHPQPRIFRGRAGPTDGNIPPKKVIRRKVKYQALEHTTDHVVDFSVQNLALNDEINATAAVVDEYTGADETNQAVNEDVDNCDDKFHQEIQHIQKRINYVTLSNKTSQGLVNPSTWRTNCLIPTRKVVKEWRDILMFHSMNKNNSSVAENETIDADAEDPMGERNREYDNLQHGAFEIKNKGLLQSTSQQVFSLIQMSLQTGPLVGSNPGYFKRCGGEVASIALVYLCEIAELAGIDESIMMMNDTIGQYDDDEQGLLLDNDSKIGEHLNDEDCYSSSSSSSSDEDLLELDSDSTCSSDNESILPSKNEIADELFIKGDSLPSGSPMPNADSRQEEVIVNNLQTKLHFSSNQSIKFYEWLINAKLAVTTNRPPSKSAMKLQSGKSKKQRLKELKLQRKLKKKKKKSEL